MNVKTRQRIERRIVRAVVQAAHKAGCTFHVNNGGDFGDEIHTSGVKETLDQMFATDVEHLFLMRPGETQSFAWIYFVYGNEGWDVISDYTSNLDKTDILKRANQLAEKYGG